MMIWSMVMVPLLFTLEVSTRTTRMARVASESGGASATAVYLMGGMVRPDLLGLAGAAAKESWYGGPENLGLTGMPLFCGPHPARSANAAMAKTKLYFKSSSKSFKSTRHDTTGASRCNVTDKRAAGGQRTERAPGPESTKE